MKLNFYIKHFLSLIIAIILFFVEKKELYAQKEVSIVILDAGHGGHDGGASRNGVYEKNITLSVAKLLRSKIKKSLS